MKTKIKIPANIAKLAVGQLHAKLHTLTDVMPSSRNKPYLQRLLVQKMAEAHAAEVARASRRVHVPPATDSTARAKDPRLPAAGETLQREYEGRTYTVRVLEGGLLECGGTQYKSLSAVAKAITGTIWNGFLFFGLAERKRAA